MTRLNRPRDPFSGWVRMAAAAAVVALMVAVPVFHRPVGDMVGDPAEQGLAVIDRALDEINGALAVDPDNRGLTRLVLQLHRSRAELMCKTVQDRIRSL